MQKRVASLAKHRAQAKGSQTCAGATRTASVAAAATADAACAPTADTSPPRSSPASLGFMFSADDDCCSAGGWEEAERDPLDLVIMIAGMGGEAGAQVEGESAAEQSELLRGGCVKRIPLVLSPPAQREPRQPLPPQGEGEGAEEGEGAGAGAGAGKVEGEKVGGREGDDASTRSAATTGASPPSSASASSCGEGEFIDIESLLDLQDMAKYPREVALSWSSAPKAWVDAQMTGISKEKDPEAYAQRVDTVKKTWNEFTSEEQHDKKLKWERERELERVE
jgi:hypothetical protein